MNKKKKIGTIIVMIVAAAVIGFLLYVAIVLFIYLGRGPVTYDIEVSDAKETIKAIKKENAKRYEILRIAAYEEGKQDFEQYGERKGPDYPEKIINLVPKNTGKRDPITMYKNSYEKGFQDAQKKSQE